MGPVPETTVFHKGSIFLKIIIEQVEHHQFYHSTCEAAASDSVVEVVVGELRDVLYSPHFVSALTSALITLQGLPESCRARRDEKKHKISD